MLFFCEVLQGQTAFIERDTRGSNMTWNSKPAEIELNFDSHEFKLKRKRSNFVVNHSCPGLKKHYCSLVMSFHDDKTFGTDL